MHELTLLAGIGILGAAVVLVFPPKPGGQVARRHLLHCGFLLFAMDLAIELTGTTTGMWHYNRSIYFLFGHVPVELLVMFWGGGVLLAAVHLFLAQLQSVPSITKVFAALTFIGLVVYVWNVGIQGQGTTLLLITIPTGIWGFHSIRREQTKAAALLLAGGVAVLDHLVETWIVGSGSYDYSSGFGVETPLTYGLLVLAVLGWLDYRFRSD